MNVKIQAVHFDADGSLLDRVQRKIEKLPSYSKRIVDVNVFLKLDNLAHHIKDKVVEIRVHVPRGDLFVKTCSKTFEASFERAYHSLVTQLKRKKDRQLP
ncbi:MAG: HPF/RaiA family ribosome-associated protein [Sphingomonadales bacterium]|jgi:putative sigma-54 modulation protein|nr:HPF/RaiA family ribosome-associated protein [Sphingomonadales bacterium]